MDPTDIPERYRLTLNEPLARHWLAHAIAYAEGYEPQEHMLSDVQAGELNELEAALRRAPRAKVSRKLTMLRDLDQIDVLRAGEHPVPDYETLPGIDLRYNPQSTEDADATGSLVSWASYNALISGAHIDFAFSYSVAGDTGYWWHLTLGAGGPAPLTLFSMNYDMDTLAEDHARGLDAAMQVLREAVRACNELLEAAARAIGAIMSRRPCSCGAGWADEPGHDDHEAGQPAVTTT